MRKRTLTITITAGAVALALAGTSVAVALAPQPTAVAASHAPAKPRPAPATAASPAEPVAQPTVEPAHVAEPVAATPVTPEPALAPAPAAPTEWSPAGIDWPSMTNEQRLAWGVQTLGITAPVSIVDGVGGQLGEYGWNFGLTVTPLALEKAAFTIDALAHEEQHRADHESRVAQVDGDGSILNICEIEQRAEATATQKLTDLGGWVPAGWSRASATRTC
ncbi:hypothetical protein [Leifsonia sp. Leaf264]|uniref:hypothetical protein n=1 Tax=Leifsonia sp. Leaf264 TaxID=1736314 RepID=UPI0006F58FE6|nr:hypothetical protein [Leifsonia sp. Leaf264]KQP01446.1 hypothetical protein ASF30_02175 [Leifsonia sp. Leaf264]